MVTITLFGSMSIFGPDTSVPIGGRCACLLAYVALHRGRPIARAELLENVWADRGDRLNPSTFTTALWRLRQRLRPLAGPDGELLTCDADGNVQFNPAVALTLDVAEFERAVVPALHASADELSAHVAQLEAAAALYRADLLLDHHDEWILRERERLRRLHLNGLGRLLEHATAAGAHREAMLHAQAILDHEPLREDVHCALMRAQWAAGQRAMALRQFEQCRTLLRTELAIAPMPDTVALYRRIAESGLNRNVLAGNAIAEAGGAYTVSSNAAVAQSHAGRSQRAVRGTCRRAGERRRLTASPVRLVDRTFDNLGAPDEPAHVSTPALLQARAEFDAARRCLVDATARLLDGLALMDH